MALSFSDINPEQQLFISAVLQKTFIDVNVEGNPDHL